MSQAKRQVRMTTASVKNPKTGEIELAVRAETKFGNKTVTAQGEDEKAALARLQSKLNEVRQRADFRATYPKTVEVDW